MTRSALAGALGLAVVATSLVSAQTTKVHRIGLLMSTTPAAAAHIMAAFADGLRARLTDQFRRAAEYVDKILKGASPATLPVEQPTAFELVVNLRNARAMKVAIPQTFIIRADEVLQ